ncbi:MAG: hypothetical protein MK212_11875 [Saprospiraceae bacterium]|nr:hypothetical protein [Saprospiraceae bacterium]
MQKIIVFGGIILCCLACSKPRDTIENTGFYEETSQEAQAVLDAEILDISRGFRQDFYYRGNSRTLHLEDSLLEAHKIAKRFGDLQVTQLDLYTLRNLSIDFGEDSTQILDEEFIKQNNVEQLYDEVKTLEKKWKKEAYRVLSSLKNTYGVYWRKSQQNQINSGSQYVQDFYLIHPSLDKKAWSKLYLRNRTYQEIKNYVGNCKYKCSNLKFVIMYCLKQCRAGTEMALEEIFQDYIVAVNWTPHLDTDSLTVLFSIGRRLKCPDNAFLNVDGQKIPFDMDGTITLDRIYSEKDIYEATQIEGTYKYRELEGAYEYRGHNYEGHMLWQETHIN